jgi:nucleolar protein 16
MKKGAPKVKVGLVKRRKDVKAKLPLEIREGRADVEKRLQQKPDWSETATLTANYGANKFVLNPNEGFGRNQNQRGRPPLKTPEERAAADGATFDDDDELRAATGKMRKSGKAAPQPLTATQQEVVRRLLDAHGEDVEVRLCMRCVCASCVWCVVCFCITLVTLSCQRFSSSKTPLPHNTQPPQKKTGVVPRHQAQPHAALGRQAQGAAGRAQVLRGRGGRGRARVPRGAQAAKAHSLD